jgi:hypothetical protein
MEARLKSRRFAALGGLLALAGGVAALTPGASAAGTVHKCANKALVLELPGAPGEAPRKYKLTIKAIAAQGVSCAAAYKFIGLEETNTTRTTPEHYKCTSGHFKAPIGTVPTTCTKPGAKIQFAGPGG